MEKLQARPGPISVKIAVNRFSSHITLLQYTPIPLSAHLFDASKNAFVRILKDFPSKSYYKNMQYFFSTILLGLFCIFEKIVFL